jgi:hypothetical protein
MAGAYKIAITYDTFQNNIKFFLIYPDNEILRCKISGKYG